MADQAFAQTGAIAPPVRRPYTLSYKLAWRLRVLRCWTRCALLGVPTTVPELTDFVLGNYFFTALQVPSELRALGEILAELQPRRALEIGTAHGGTLLFLTRLASPQATIASVDLPGGRFGGGYGPRRRWWYQRFARREQKLHLLQGDSHSPEMLSRVKAAFKGEPLDYLFIDGDHTYEGVKSDFETYGPLVRKGGVIAFHDIVEGKAEMVGGVPRFWREVRPGFRHNEFVKDPRQGGWGIGVLYV